MGDCPTDEVDSYLRAAIVTSDHPGKPLEGTVVTISTSHDISVNESFFEALIQQAEKQFDINNYATGLRLGTVYFDASSQGIVGVLWEDSPLSYDHGDLEKPVAVLPDNLVQSDDLLE